MAGVAAPPPTADEGAPRRAAPQMLAAALAMAAVLLGGALVTRGGGGGGLPGPGLPTPTATPRGDWLASIPAVFPLALGLVDAPEAGIRTVADPHPTWSDKVGCRPVPSVDRLDARRSSATTGRTYRSRELALYPDESVAARQFAALEEAAIGCTDRAFLGSDQIQRVTFTPLAEGRALLQALRYDGGRRVPGRKAAVVAQVGNAVLLVTLRDESATPAGVTDAAAVALLKDTDGLVERMCVFDADPCRAASARSRP